MKRAVIMARVSSDEQLKGYSIGIQQERLQYYCEKNNIEILEIFKEDHSAKSFARPEFNRLLAYIKANRGKVDCLLVTTWDRFSRNTGDAYMMIRKLEKLGVRVQATDQPIDTSIPENKAMLAFYLAIPEIENDVRSIKIKGGVRAARKAGRWAGPAPKGYKNARDEDNKPTLIFSKDANHIKFIFEEYARGKSQAKILQLLKKKALFYDMIDFL